MRDGGLQEDFASRSRFATVRSAFLEQGETHMKKTLIALAAAAALTAGTITTPQPARADISAFWLLPAFVVGTWVGAAHPHAFPFWGAHCWYETRKIRGKHRTVRVCG
jgi:hypothetical protein